MKNNLFHFILCVVLLAGILSACGPDKQSFAIEFSGPCEACPPSRLDSLLKLKPGILNVAFSGNNEKVTIEYDAHKLKKQDIIDYLNDNGYDAGPNEPAIAFGAGEAPLCCEFDSTLAGDLDATVHADEELDDELEKKFESDLDAGINTDIDIDVDDMAVSDELDEDNLFDESEVDKMLASDTKIAPKKKTK